MFTIAIGAGLAWPICYSSLVLRFVKDQFDDYRESTIGGLSYVS